MFPSRVRSRSADNLLAGTPSSIATHNSSVPKSTVKPKRIDPNSYFFLAPTSLSRNRQTTKTSRSASPPFKVSSSASASTLHKNAFSNEDADTFWHRKRHEELEDSLYGSHIKDKQVNSSQVRRCNVCIFIAHFDRLFVMNRKVATPRKMKPLAMKKPLIQCLRVELLSINLRNRI
jgi:hypothetical protein